MMSRNSNKNSVSNALYRKMKKKKKQSEQRQQRCMATALQKQK
jgi:hypothetical protein